MPPGLRGDTTAVAIYPPTSLRAAASPEAHVVRVQQRDVLTGRGARADMAQHGGIASCDRQTGRIR